MKFEPTHCEGLKPAKTRLVTSTIDLSQQHSEQNYHQPSNHPTKSEMQIVFFCFFFNFFFNSFTLNFRSKLFNSILGKKKNV